MPKVAKKKTVTAKKAKKKAKAAPKKAKAVPAKREANRGKATKSVKAAAKLKGAEETKPAKAAAAPKEAVKKPLVLKPRFSKREYEDIREQLVSMLSAHREEIVQGVRSAGMRDLAHIQDSSDIATDSAEGDLTFRLAESVGVEAVEIERAIEKIDEGSYGYCDVSNKPIPMERLRFLPWASRLVEYQERYELRRKRREEGELEDLDAGDDLSEE